MIALLAWCAFGVGPAAPQNVAPMAKVARMVNWVEDLSTAFGTPVEVSAALKDEVLAVVSGTVSAKELQAKIAECLDASWVKDGSRLRLERTKANERAMQEREQRALTAAVERWKAQTRAELDRQGEFTSVLADALVQQLILSRTQPGQQAAWASGVRRLPSVRFAQHVGLALPTQQLATLRVGQRKVFRQQPNRLQAKFDVPKSVIAATIAEFDAYEKARLRSSQPDALEDILTPFKGEATEVVAAVTCTGNRLEIRAYLTNRAGDYILKAAEPIRLTTFPAGDQAVGQQLSRYEFGPLAEEMRSISRSMRTPPYLNPSPALREFVRQPDTREPLEVGGLDALRGLHVQSGKSVVARPWDDLLFVGLGLLPRTTATTESFRDALRALGGHLLEDDRWVSVSMPFPTRVSSQVINRTTLREFLDACQRTGYAPLDEIARFALKRADYVGDLHHRWAFLAGCLYDSSTNLIIPNPMLRIYGSLTDRQRAALRSNTPIPWSDLTQETRETISRVVFGAGAPALMVKDGQAHSIHHDPTSLWSDGTVRGVSLRVAYVNSQDCLMESPDPLPPYSLPLVHTGSAFLGYQLARQGREKMSNRRFRIGSKMDMMLEVQLEQEITMAGDVYGLEALTSESFRLDALPEPFRSRVNKAEGYYREHPDARQPNPRGGRNAGRTYSPKNQRCIRTSSVSSG